MGVPSKQSYNRLARFDSTGVADAGAVSARTGWIEGQFTSTEWAAGATHYHPNMAAGRVRRFVVTEQDANNDADSVITLSNGATDLKTLTVDAAGKAAGRTLTSGIIADVAANLVDIGTALKIACDGVPNAGAGIRYAIWVDAADQ